MRVIGNGRRFVLVTGMARSGTTLLASILNSAGNAVILSEPHNSLLKRGYVHADKLLSEDGKLGIGVKDIVPLLRRSPFELIGVKEVCERIPDRDELFLDYALDATDLVLVMFRNPVDTIASQRQVIGFRLSESLVILANFMDWVDRQRKRRDVRIVSYEELCRDPLAHLNDVLGNALAFEGPLVRSRMEGFGDWRALGGEAVEPFRSRRNVLTEDEVRAIEAVAESWFEDRYHMQRSTRGERCEASIVSSQRFFNYTRVGYDSRPIELLEGGKIGIGRARCEEEWAVWEDSTGGLTLVIKGGEQVTCRLRKGLDGRWVGKWVIFERMPVVLTPLPGGATIDAREGVQRRATGPSLPREELP